MTTIGRVLRFHSCFEYAFASRFTPAGWIDTERFFRGIVEKAARNPDSEEAKMPSAFRMLRALPECMETWRSIGISWDELYEHISDEALNRYSISQVINKE
jgi:hypothetical protein